MKRFLRSDFVLSIIFLAASLTALACSQGHSGLYTVHVMSGGQVVRIFEKAKVESGGMPGLWHVTDADGKHIVQGELVATPYKGK